MKSVDSPAVVTLEGGQVNASLALPHFVSRGNACKFISSRCQLKCDVTRPETGFRLLAKRTNPFKSAGASVQSTAGSRGVRIGGSNAGYTVIRGSVKGTGYPLHSPVSPSLPLLCVTVCQHISTGVYRWTAQSRAQDGFQRSSHLRQQFFCDAGGR